MAQFELVWVPILLAVLLFLLAIWVYIWRIAKLKGVRYRLPGSTEVLVLSISLMILSGTCLFVGLFFFITG